MLNPILLAFVGYTFNQIPVTMNATSHCFYFQSQFSFSVPDETIEALAEHFRLLYPSVKFVVVNIREKYNEAVVLCESQRDEMSQGLCKLEIAGMTPGVNRIVAEICP